MRTIFILVKFYDRRNNADDLVQGRLLSIVEDYIMWARTNPILS